jgi:acetyl-CoA carboxylase/biotin carboxylase 1
LKDGELEEVQRPHGLNDIGMVAWKVELFTPEYPNGRYLILLSNDITHQIGSFGVPEDNLFKKVSEYSRIHGYPRIYMAANSGARIGLAEEVKSKFRVSWADPTDPTKGFEYLYLTEEEYTILSRLGSVHAKKSCPGPLPNNRYYWFSGRPWS